MLLHIEDIIWEINLTLPNGLKAQVHPIGGKKPIGGKMLRAFLTDETIDVIVNYVYAYLKDRPKTRKNIKAAILLAQNEIILHIRKGKKNDKK